MAQKTSIADALARILRNKAEAAQIRENAILAGTWPKGTPKTPSKQTSQPISQTAAPTSSQKTEESQLWDSGSQPLSQQTQTKLKANEAKKRYDDYVKSDEYRQRLSENDKKAKQQEVANMFLPQELRAPKVIQDEKEQRLRAAMEQAEAEYNASEDQQVMDADVADMGKLSDEERQQLEQYAVNQIRDQNLPVELAGSPFMKTAEQEATGLIGKIGKQRADELAETFMRQENAKLARQVDERSRAFANEHGFLASAATVPINAVSGLVGSVGQLQGMARRTGRYQTLDPNATGTIGDTFTGAVRGQVQQNIEEDLGSGIVGKTASTLYQGAMSIADSYARAFLGGGAVGGAALAATNAFSQVMADASRQGASPAQAALLATSTAAIEALSEKIPLDNLIKHAKGGKQPIRTILKNALFQAGIEATTEEISLVGSLLAEAAILREKSNYEQTVMVNIMQGKSATEARNAAAMDVWKEAVNTALVSMVSGGFSSLGGSLAANKNLPVPPSTEEVREQAQRQIDDQEANWQALEKNKELEQQGQEAAQKPAETPKVQAQAPTEVMTQKGMKAPPVSQPGKQQTPKTGLDVILETIQGNGGNVSNKMAESVLNDAEARAQLVQQMGTDIAGTKAEQRKAVKDALTTMAAKQKQDKVVSVIVDSILGKKADNSKQADSQPVHQPELAQPQSQEESFDTTGTVGSAKSKFRHEVRESGVYANTFRNANNETTRAIGEEAQRLNPRIGQYDVITEEESLNEARLRTETAQDRYVEHRQLMKKDGWTGADNDTAMRLLATYRKEGKGDRFRELVRKQKEMATQGGQLSQSFAKYSRSDATVAVQDAVESLEQMGIGDVPRKFWKADKTRAANVGDPDDYSSTGASRMTATEQGNSIFSKRKMDRKSFDAWKTSITNSMLEIANDIEAVQEDDVDAMRDIVRQLAQFRRTTAWFGTQDRLTKNADRILNKMDFETAKTIAKAQLAMIPDDFRKRSAGEVAKTIRIHNMLSALTTTNRNTVGNTTMGIMDAFSDSTAARAMDIAMSKITGIRTVGNDLKYGKTYLNAARDAADMASLCVELNIPLESESLYSAGNTRTHSTQGGPISRFLSAYEKYMKYSLEVTDKFFEGGSTAAVNQSIRDLGAKAGLSETQIEGLSERTARRRTFKENRSLAAGAKKIKEGANTMFGVGDVGTGDILMPFAGVPMEVGQTAVDYSGSGAVLGIKEMIDVINAAKNGDKAIKNSRTGESVPIEIAQRKAVSDFGRGVTGVSLIALSTAAAAAGMLKVHNSEDWEEKAMDQSQNLDGAQFNLSAAWRDIIGDTSNGDTTAWRTNDIVFGMDFLEPFNSAMYIGYSLSQEDSIADMIKNYPKHALLGVADALMDMPVMTLLSDVQELVQSIGETDEEGNPATRDALGQVAGTLATSVVPSFVRQAAQTIDPYYRDTYDPDPLKQAGKQVVASVPFASMTLPKKYNGLGEEQKRYDNTTAGGKFMGALNNLFLPDDVEKVKGNDVSDYIGRLSETTGETSMYPEKQAPYKFMLRGREVELTGEQRATYQKTYGEKNMELYSGLINYPGFSDLPEDVQIDAFRNAKSYATKFAKAAVSDYRDVPEQSTEDLIKDIFKGSVNRTFTSAFSDLTESWDLGYDDAEAKKTLDQAYSVYESLPVQEKNEFFNNASGRVKYYLRAIGSGMGTETFAEMYGEYRDIDGSESLTTTEKANEWAAVLEEAVDNGYLTEKQKDVLKDDLVFRYSLQAETEKFDEAIESGVKTDVAKMIVDLVMNAQGTGSVNKDTGKKTVRNVDKWQVLAESNLTEAEKDIAIKLYMSDYDPNASSVDRTEVKYEYARQVYGLSPEEYVETKRAYDDNRYKKDKIAAFKSMGYSESMANNLYHLYYGNQDRVPSVEWYERNFR